MKQCGKYGRKVFILDRPNPINGQTIEGNVLEKGNESFVGMYPIPMRHGMTCGELALFFNKEFGINCDLEIITMEGWARDNYYDETDAPWVMPSPNMPTTDTAVVFPATVFFEGTQVSEGRGTTRPFEIVGAPYVNSDEYADALNLLNLPGVFFRAVEFLPTFQKHAQVLCGGVFVHVTERESFQSVITGVAMVKKLFEMYPNDFKWKKPPYEYVYERNPFDVIAGTTRLRRGFEQGISLNEIKQSWQADILEFQNKREKYLLYS